MKHFLILLLLQAGIAAAQEVPDPVQEEIEQRAEFLDGFTEEENEGLLQQLEGLKKNPIDLNRADAETLRQLYWLSEIQIRHLIQYRQLLGRLVDIHELQSIPGWDPALIRKLLPYVTVSSAVSGREEILSRFKGVHTLLLRDSRKWMSSSDSFPGSPDHLLLRYQYAYRHLLSFGFTAEKDAGEQFLRGAQKKGFDFYSWHFYLGKKGILQGFVLGDYTVNLGQGLLIWQSPSFGTSGMATGIKKQGPVFQPYRSAGEYNFKRGLAFSLGKNKWKASFFYSGKKIDGNMERDSFPHFTSISISGYHRKGSELENRNTVPYHSIGAQFHYETGAFELSMNAVRDHFGYKLMGSDEPYRKFYFGGKTLSLFSFDYGYTYRNIHLFGEWAADHNLHNALLSGILICIDPKADFSFLYRKMQAKYPSLSGNAFSENSLPVNEKGYYASLSLRPSNSWTIFMSVDIFQFPYLGYRRNAPGSGHRYEVHVNYQPDKKTSWLFRYRYHCKPLNKSASFPIPEQKNEISRGIRVQFAQKINTSTELRYRIEMNGFGDSEREKGYLFYAEMKFKLSHKMKIGVRLQYVETDGYNSRVYAYEPDLPYSYSVPAFYGKGLYHFVNLQYKLSNFSSLAAKWSSAHADENAENDDSYQPSNGKPNTELKLQALISF